MKDYMKYKNNDNEILIFTFKNNTSSFIAQILKIPTQKFHQKLIKNGNFYDIKFFVKKGHF